MTLESVETSSKSFIIIINFIVKSIRNQHLIRILFLFGKYYARSDILCSPSENCTSLMRMTLANLLIRPIRSIRRTDAFIHNVTSSFHATIASYYSNGDRLHFRRNKHVQYACAVKINTKDKP